MVGLKNLLPYQRVLKYDTFSNFHVKMRTLDLLWTVTKFNLGLECDDLFNLKTTYTGVLAIPNLQLSSMQLSAVLNKDNKEYKFT